MQLLSFIKKKFGIALIVLFYASISSAAQLTSTHRISWSHYTNFTFNNVSYPHFITFRRAAFYPSTFATLPVFSFSQKISNEKDTKVFLKNEIYEPIDRSVSFQNKELVNTKGAGEIFQSVAYDRGMPSLTVYFLPIRYNAASGTYEKLVSFDLVVSYNDAAPKLSAQLGKKSFAANSVLAQGEWHKIGVINTGLHKIDSQFFVANKIDLSNIDPATIKIYGNGAGMLPQLNAAPRYDDLQENAIVVAGEADGRFDAADYILFYGQAQNDVWWLDTLGHYNHSNNIYADTTYYFITFGGAAGKRVIKQASVPAFNTQATEFDYNVLHELERANLLGSGKLWVGEEFDKLTQQTFTVSMGSINTSQPVFFRSSVVGRSITQNGFQVIVGGNNAITHVIGSVPGDFENPYGQVNVQSTTTSVSSAAVDVTYTYNQPVAGSIGWLDYFELQSRNQIRMLSSQLSFRDSKSIGAGKITKFNIENANANLRVWDLGNRLVPQELIVTLNGSSGAVTTSTDTLKELIAFDGRTYLTPVYRGRIGNQNLHALPATDYVIITHPRFINEARQVAALYTGKLRVQVIPVDQVYNEFSSGAQDVCAIRDLMRMLYKRATVDADLPKYLMLFGRASYDYKYRVSGNTNFVLTYESAESMDPLSSYNSDDFFGFLDDAEGRWDSPADGNIKKDKLDIGIGRLPAQNNAQAQDMVNKIRAYKTHAGDGDWKNRVVFIADDEDSNTHLSQAEAMANDAISDFKNYNIEKIYLDAFKEVEEAGGARNPDAQAAIVRSVERGAILVNYTGHGGQAGLAHERVLNTDDINGWTNGLKLPLFVTATCEFSRFDDPLLTSAGEMVLLNPNGGGIALFTTVRLVSSGSNFSLNQYFYEYAGLDSASAFNRLDLGEIMRRTKNDYSGDKNDRNFTLLGDPAMMLAYPGQRVRTTAINTRPVTNVPDTMKAFAKVSVEGVVTDLQGNMLANYNGIVYPTVFDKMQSYTTIANDPASFVQGFQMQTNAIYRGKATVKNGVFQFSFIVPKDITYQNGFGKISYYAQNDQSDAQGNYQNFIVGGTADSVAPDNNGPQIALFMNDEKFVNGGLTDENPLFIAKLKDENGINIVGTGIGRDLLLTIHNQETNQSITVNDYYQAKLDTYQEGDVNYRFKKLPQGNNNVKLRAWDVYNNLSESSLDFVVASSEDLALKHVLNYPNPFTTHTTFHFDHNKAGEQMNVLVQIFTVSGKLVKTLTAESVAATGHFDQIEWDGRDDYGDAIGKGVYVYKVRVKSGQSKTAEEYQKLVILN